MTWQKLLIVALGGALGASLRYLISSALFPAVISIPLGTLAVNVLGGFAMGFIMGLAPKTGMNDTVRTFLTTGIMGGLTTFSTFSNETYILLSEGSFMLGGVNILTNLAGALCACWIGHALAYAF